jgi:predicted phage terminase large subunit-like protein
MYKIKATLMIDKLIALYIDLLKENVPIKIAIETVQFQEFFKDTLDDKCKSIGLHLPIVPIKNTVNKELRIDSISPLVNNHTILVDKKSLIFIDELDTYPKSPHDDGLDSLEMAYRIAKKPAFDYKEALKHLKAIESKNKALQSIFDG